MLVFDAHALTWLVEGDARRTTGSCAGTASWIVPTHECNAALGFTAPRGAPDTRHMRLLAIPLLWLAPALPAAADPITLDGVTFSDELGGFTIVAASGRGTTDDPFVLVEDVTGPEQAILVIRGLDAGFGNRVGTQHLVGFALTKLAVNRTADRWTQFELELRETLDAHSTYRDGLSFGQASTVGRPFTSSGFASNRETAEPYDSVVFSGGFVAPGDGVSFSVVVTDTSPLPVFYLLQQQLRQVAERLGARIALEAPAPARYARPAAQE